MRKLLYLAAGVALLSAPAAFAQTDYQNQNPPPASTPAQPGPPPSPDMTDSQGNPVGAPPSAVQPGPPPSDQSMPPSATQPGQPPQPGDTGEGTRLYTNEGQTTNPAELQQISNAPVPDTKATRAKYRPLSAAGRRTRAAGN
jgi:hypothetical protein